MEEYTIEIHHAEGSWFEPTSTLHNLSYLEIVELYAFTKAYKFPLSNTIVVSYNNFKSGIYVEEFIIQQSINLHHKNTNILKQDKQLEPNGLK